MKRRVGSLTWDSRRCAVATPGYGRNPLQGLAGWTDKRVRLGLRSRHVLLRRSGGVGFWLRGPAACGREGRAGKVESRSEEGDLRLCFGGASFSGCRKDTCGQRHGGRTLDGVWSGVGSRATGTARAGGPLGRQVENLSYGRPGGRVRGLTVRATSEVGETNSGWRGGGPLYPLRWMWIGNVQISWAAKRYGSAKSRLGFLADCAVVPEVEICS
jgi:hypothetical protein